MLEKNKTYNSLPAWTYLNESFFELEAEILIRRSWQLVCHVSDIPNVGNYFRFQFVGEDVFVIRDENGEVKAFHNVCSHRAARLLDGNSGSCKSRIVCPYHAWSYDLAGNLMGVPHEGDFGGLDKRLHGLKPIECEIFLGFIFVRVKGEGPSVKSMFAPYLDELLPYRFEDLKPTGRVTLRPRTVNWKNIADNYVDALHIPIAHPGLSSFVGTNYGIEVRGDIHKMYSKAMATRKETLSVKAYKKFLPDVPWLPKENRDLWVYFRLWPNLAFDIYPDQIDFMQFIPISATETLIREIPYSVPDENLDNSREMKAARYLNWRINREVNREDTALVGRVQDGMSSSSYSTGPLAQTEVCLIDSFNKMEEAIPVSTEPVQPSYERLQKLIDEARLKP